MRSKGHIYVVAESMYSDRSRIPMNPAIPLSYQHAMSATR